MPKNNIAILTTGGTISSNINDEDINIDKNNTFVQNYINKNNLNNNIDIISIFNKLSENFKPTDWIKIANEIKKIIDNKYDKIIVTHGTDSMVYSAVAIEILFGYLSNTTIIFTGAMKPPKSKYSDAKTAIKSSIKIINDSTLKNGVYINIRSKKSHSVFNLYQATKVKLPQMDDNGFESIYNEKIAQYKNKQWRMYNNTYTYRFNKELKIPSKSSVNNVQDKIIYRNIYPGITLDISEDIEIVILNGYHSGTASTMRYNNSLINCLNNKNNTKYVLTNYSSKLIEKPYNSTLELMDNGITLIKDIQSHVVYTYMYLSLAQN